MEDFMMIAGPCSIESKDMLRKIAKHLKEMGISYLRGGAFKSRTRSDSWKGHGEVALRWMQEVAEEFSMKTVSEMVSPEDLPLFIRYKIDIIQIGARNAKDIRLLESLKGRDVLYKNPLDYAAEEWLRLASVLGDREKTLLCLRGKDNEKDIARFGQDIAGLVHMVQNSGYRIIFDPSHSTGKRELVFGASLAALAAGASGLIIEVHPDPDKAMTDGRQSLTFKEFSILHNAIKDFSSKLKEIAAFRDSFLKA